MQGDYISDLMIFLLSLMFIIVYMYMYAPIDTSRDVRLDVEITAFSFFRTEYWHNIS